MRNVHGTSKVIMGFAYEYTYQDMNHQGYEY